MPMLGENTIDLVSPKLGTETRHSAFMVSPVFDLFFLLGAPLLALSVATLCFKAESPISAYRFWGTDTTLAALLFARIFTQAHIFLVIGRSHLNLKIFKSYPVRFTVVPLGLIAASYFSNTILIGTVIIGGLWDIYHSSMQTFGLARIYDSKLRNSPEVGRNLDIYLNHFIYIGAIIAGFNFLPSLESIFSYRNHPLALGTPILSFLHSHLEVIQRFTILSGILFLIYYIGSYYQLIKNGYVLSLQKIILLTITAFVSIYTWNYFPLTVALFVVNFFHALQYFAVMWWTEKTNLQKLLKLPVGAPQSWGMWLLLFLFLLVPFAYGSGVILNKGIRLLFCVGSVFSLMHYWYDGFIWSVRKQQFS